MTEGRYYFMPNFALGLQYDYLRVARLPDKMHLHYIHPNITYRYLWSEGNQGAFLSFGIGYMNYQERTYQRGERNGISFQRGYCGLSFGMGYEFYITKKLSGVFRADILTADWLQPDARLSNPYDYDDGIDHSWFKTMLHSLIWDLRYNLDDSYQKLSLFHLHRHNLLQNTNCRFHILHILHQHTTTSILFAQIAATSILHHVCNNFTECLTLIIGTFRIGNKE